ncbi:hypothetical protein VFPPC_13552 [Pochonia chlamydosporia 170]|uniref:Uncharacterized protein n=1 Tax=Pochonia chlamydosporia 170 TaxID=1380566 RepID=A0A179FQR6_METCM|nr:hypothetical protein VFPPC_13552 [Pochonia chlamydosporia 170]OAQ67608.2 hypothetical protein VFPPC_13552 [Pochonia chlamydosporia 170]
MDKLKSFDKRFFLRVGSALLAFTAMISAFSAIAKKDWGLALGLGVVGFLGLAENLIVAFLRKRGIGSTNNRLHAALDIAVTVLWAILPFGLVIFWQSQLKNGKADRANEGSVLRLIVC